jgi:hypothetical protein
VGVLALNEDGDIEAYACTNIIFRVGDLVGCKREAFTRTFIIGGKESFLRDHKLFFLY